MSSNTPTTSYYAPLPNPQTTNPTQYYLLQTLGEGTRRRAPVPHPAQDLTPRAHRRRHARYPTATQNGILRRARNLQRRCNTVGRKETELQRKLREEAKKMHENLDRYGTSHPKELILESDVSFVADVLRDITPEHVNALYEFAVGLEKAGEEVPRHIVMLFNTIMGRDLMMPLVVRTFEIAIR
ncbi:hypothetical protein SLS53_000755 [Cytospora paraplurivora]|uniref:Uncharacterized protein n=1 Tax=Cytospora paraplurivora TaxID=2898453 RepID=A0AAN9UJG4_9PEZI